MGLLLVVFVLAANIYDSQAGWNTIALLKGRFSRLRKIFTDGGSIGAANKVKYLFDWVIEIVLRTEKIEKLRFIA